MTSSSAGHSGPGDAVAAAAAPPSISHPAEASALTSNQTPAAPDAPAATSLASASASESAPGQQPDATAPAAASTANQESGARPVTPSAAAANTNGGAAEVANQPPVQPADTAMIDVPPPFATPTKMSAAAGASSFTAPAAPASNTNANANQDIAMANTTTNTDQYAPSTPFTPVSAPTLDQQAYMMMALAMSNAGNGMSPPPTVTPSQVTLPNPMDPSFNTLRQPGADKGLESFARIEFADSVFQMTTYAVIIGRDQRALEQARRDEKREEQHKRRIEENASQGLPPPSPMMQDRSKFSKSYVSEEGGMLGPESDSEESGRPQKRRRTSTNGSSQQQEAEENPDNIISNRQYVSHTPGAAAVDLASLRPSPWHVPIIGIHSPGPNIASKTKAISREHLKIAYNQEEGVFEAIPLHKNGFFCEDVHYKSDKVVLRCGDRLQIKDIDFRFMINGVERGRTGAEEVVDEKPTKKGGKKKQTHGGKEMSFEFEQAHGNGQLQDTSDELSDLDGSGPDLSDLGDGDDDDEEDEEEEEEETTDVKHEAQGDGADPSMPQIPKKRGPGRPPKNGIMSKREQRLLKKQQQELAKKSLPEAPPVEPPVKRKVGRPRKHPLPENASNPEKRKYKPRKPKGEDGAEGSDAERRAREKKEKKARPKSPPLELKIEDYSEEQLQKPNKNYGVLIDETLTAAGPDGLTLKQIYKRICQRYPWFHFHTETKGWESSVRHNLIGNEAFKKDETTNLWSRVPGVELDAGKKRKASSPDRNLAAQNYAPYAYPYNAQHMQQAAAAGYPQGQVPQGYPMQGYPGQQQQQQVQGAPRPVQQYQQPPNAAPGQQPQRQQQQPPQLPGQPGQQPQQIQPQPHLHQQQPVQPAQAGQAPVPGAAQPPAPTPVPAYGVPSPALARPAMGVPQQSAYSSPYASRPPPPAPMAGQVKAEDGAAALAQAGHQAAAVGQAGSKAPASQGAASQPGAQRVSATPPASALLRPVVDPRLLQAVVGLKNGLVENLGKARNPKAEAIVMSALNRCIGLKKVATENDKMEAICIKGIRQVIDGFTSKNKSPTPGASAATPGPDDPAAIFEPKVLTSLNGFKDVSVKALKARLGEAKAEAVTLSAIDRVLGFVDASIMPPAVEGETPGNLEGVEQHLMNSIRQLLRGMNQKIHGP